MVVVINNKEFDMLNDILIKLHTVTVVFGGLFFITYLVSCPEPSSRKVFKEAIELFLICAFILEILPIALCVVIFKFVKRLINNT